MPYAKGRVVTAHTCINKKGHGFTGKIQMVVIDLQKQPCQQNRTAARARCVVGIQDGVGGGVSASTLSK